MENKQKNNISKIQIYHAIRPKHPILRAFAMSFVTEGCKISQNFGRLAN